MKKLRYLIVVICVLAVGAGSIYCFNVYNLKNEASAATDSPSNEIKTELNLSNTYFPGINNPKSVYDASWAHEYNNISDLYTGADDVIVADVVDSGESSISGLVDFTKINVKVIESLKNAFKYGDIVTIIETGKSIDQSEDLSIDGVPLLKQYMKVILFIKKNDDNTCQILNDYVGKYFINSDGKITYSGNLTTRDHIQIDGGLKDGSSIDDFLTLINGIKIK